RAEDRDQNNNPHHGQDYFADHIVLNAPDCRARDSVHRARSTPNSRPGTGTGETGPHPCHRLPRICSFSSASSGPESIGELLSAGAACSIVLRGGPTSLEGA